jgi:hypothetical protein
VNSKTSVLVNRTISSPLLDYSNDALHVEGCFILEAKKILFFNMAEVSGGSQVAGTRYEELDTHLRVGQGQNGRNHLITSPDGRIWTI